MKRLWWSLLSFTIGTNLVTPLFPLYQIKFHMNNADITLLFATYAIFLLPSLLLIGSLSDQIGRKPVLLPTIVLMTVASVIFAFSSDFRMLYLSRALQGIATGGFLGTCTAFMVDHSKDQRVKTLLLASFTTMLGFGLGPGITGILVQYVPLDPFQSPFLAHIILMCTALFTIVTVGETVTHKGTISTKLKIGIPSDLRVPFWRFIAPAAFLFFALNGTVISLIPTFIVSVLHMRNYAIGGCLIFLLMLTGGIAQILVRNKNIITVTKWGMLLTVLGAFIIIASSPTQSLWVLLLGIVIEGIGNGWTFKGSLALAGQISTPDTRAQVMSSYYIAAYTGFSIPVFSVGLLSTFMGLENAILILSIILTIPVFITISMSKSTLRNCRLSC